MSLKDLIGRMDQFVREIVNSQDITYEEKKRLGEELRRQAEAICPSLPLDSRNVLEQRVANLRRILSRWRGMEISPQADELTRLISELGILRHLAGAYPTPPRQAQIDELVRRIGVLKQSLPQPLPEAGVEAVDTRTPPELETAMSFRRTMQQRVFADETSLRSAIASVQAEIRRLESYRSTLDFNRDVHWGRQAFDEIGALASLIQKWNREIAYLRSQETEARTYRWQQDKAREETRRYVGSKEAALARGKEQIDAIRTLRQASKELEKAFSLCQMVMSKAQAQQIPEVIPMDAVAATIARFEGILGGLQPRLPEAEVRDATNKLNRIKAYEAEMRRVLGRLGYYKEVAGYEATTESEGVRYFRANLPGVVREILSTRVISKLEALASKGINGAKDAISNAIFMAAKQNPEKVRAVLRI